MTDSSNKRRNNVVLSLSFEGTRLEAVLLRRSNGSAEIAGTVSCNLSVNPLSNEADVVGQEIREHLEQASIRERRCVVAIPPQWAMVTQIILPPLEGEDLKGFLQMEAEKGFSSAADTLTLGLSRHPVSGPTQVASLVGVPNDLLQRLDAALRAASLVPMSFTLGLPILHQLAAGDSEAALSLLVGRSSIGLHIGHGSGLVALRSLDNGVDSEGQETPINPQVLIRELRITLGQLPAEVRQSVRTLRVFGSVPTADRLASDLQAPARALGLHVERVPKVASERLGFGLPQAAGSTPEVGVAAAFLAGRTPELEFLPPRVTAWQRYGSKYASRYVAYASVVLAAAILVVAGFFIAQQLELSKLSKQWIRLSSQVRELETLQQDIKTYRPWYDNSYRHMNVLKKLTEAFPEEGSVTAKTVEIREGGAVVCTGTARDVQSLYRAIDALRAVKEVSDVQLDQLRVKAPLQFSFNFHYGERTQP